MPATAMNMAGTEVTMLSSKQVEKSKSECQSYSPPGSMSASKNPRPLPQNDWFDDWFELILVASRRKGRKTETKKELIETHESDSFAGSTGTCRSRSGALKGVGYQLSAGSIPTHLHGRVWRDTELDEKLKLKTE